jgi:hypothetical protein
MDPPDTRIAYGSPATARNRRMRRPALLLLAALAGCKPEYVPDTYASTAVQQAAKVEQGIVVGVSTDLPDPPPAEEGNTPCAPTEE